MKLTNDEKRLIELRRTLESPNCKADALHYVETMLRAQEAVKADYGLGKEPPKPAA
jgi:hypothetical protein